MLQDQTMPVFFSSYCRLVFTSVSAPSRLPYYLSISFDQSLSFSYRWDPLI